jgi:phosphoribosylformimino-5-aminoimidazole carboxamide ribotide isomerase
MIIFPAIDLRQGCCVRLVEGRAEAQTVYSERPEQMAAEFAARGAAFLHVVDLDGAFSGEPQNAAAIRAIAAAVAIPFQLGGGLRTVAAVERSLEAGAARVIIGTKAVTEPDFMARLIAAFGPDRIVAGVDAKDGQAAIQGWVEKTALSDVDLGLLLRQAGVKTVIYTDISRDGRLQGPNTAAIARMVQETGLTIIASGGVSSPGDIQALKTIPGVTGAIIGKALYDQKITLEEALAAAKGED